MLPFGIFVCFTEGESDVFKHENRPEDPFAKDDSQAAGRLRLTGGQTMRHIEKGVKKAFSSA